jgi:hypothetical protein
MTKVRIISFFVLVFISIFKDKAFGPMDNIYDLYASDSEGLQRITQRFTTQLYELQVHLNDWLQPAQQELLHRQTHQLRSTAQLFQLEDLAACLGVVSEQTRQRPASDQKRLQQECNRLHTHISQAFVFIHQKTGYAAT